jgi:hypothetical protein
MEMFNMGIKQIGIPTTLSSIGRNFVFNEWREKIKRPYPYQVSGKCLMGNADEVKTPKGLFATGEVERHLSYYIGNYKGGRNESFMYGVDNTTDWFDYDLVSAYTTGMTHLSLAHYSRGGLIEKGKLNNFSFSTEELLNNYIIVNASFKFPPTVKFPSIPCYIDETSTVYPPGGYLFGHRTRVSHSKKARL